MADIETKAKKCAHKFKKSKKGCKSLAVENSKFCATHTPPPNGVQEPVQVEADMSEPQSNDQTMSVMAEQKTIEQQATDVQDTTNELTESQPLESDVHPEDVEDQQDDTQRLAEMFASIKQQMAQQEAGSQEEQEQDQEQEPELGEEYTEGEQQQQFPFFVVTPEMMANPSFAATFGTAFGYGVDESEQESEPRIVELVDEQEDEQDIPTSPSMEPIDEDDDEPNERQFQFQPVFRTINEKPPKKNRKVIIEEDVETSDEPVFVKTIPKQTKKSKKQIEEFEQVDARPISKKQGIKTPVKAKNSKESPQRKTPEEPSTRATTARKVTFHPSEDDLEDKHTPAWTKLLPSKNKNKRNRKPAQHDIGTRSDSVLEDMDRDKVYARCSISDYIAIELKRYINSCPDYQDVLSVLGSADGLLVMNKFATNQWTSLKEYNGRWFHLGSSSDAPVMSVKVASKALLQLKKRVSFWDEAAKQLSQSWHPRQHQFYCFAVSYKEHHFSVAPFLANPKSFDPNVTRLDRYLIAFAQPKDAVRLANSLDAHYRPELIVLRVSEESPFLPISSLQIALVPGTPLIWCGAPDPLARKIFASESPVVAPHVRLAYVEL